MSYTAIETKVLQATNYRGTRIKAFEMDSLDIDTKPKSLMKSYDHALDTYENHRKVAIKLHMEVCTYINLNTESCKHKFVFGSTSKGFVMVTTLEQCS